MKKIILALYSLIICSMAYGQGRSVIVKHITEQIQLDGSLDEKAWESSNLINDFWQFIPTDSVKSVNPTEVRILYDDHAIYIGVRAEVKTNNYVVASLRRDFSGANNDNVTFMFDTFKDGTTAFLFGMTPYGVQRDAFISEGGSNQEGFNTTWDQKWLVESVMHDTHYILEAAIPFSSLKFIEGDNSWHLKVYRWDMQTNEQSTWVRVPQNQLLSNLAFSGEMIFEKPLGKSKKAIAVIPYINALTLKDFISGLSGNKIHYGGDVKVALGNSMNLDITVNPDFSNVEVDDIFTNLTRFEVFLPEKRQFFIDNNDLFGNYGDMFNAAKPFFSRRIGLARNREGNLIENRIIGGIRLSGKLNENWRMGFLNIQTGHDFAGEIPSNNNTMLSVQKKMFSRSNIGFFAINRQTFHDYEFVTPSREYNRVFGAEYNMASADNRWTGKFYLHKSLQPDDKKGNLSSQATATYNSRKFSATADIMHVDDGFRADLGYVPRTGILKSGNMFIYKIYPSGGLVSQHGPGAMLLYYWRPGMDFKKTDHTNMLFYTINFTDQSTLRIDLQDQYVFLLFDFDPARSRGVPLPANHDFSFYQYNLTYQSNPGKILSINAASSGGQFYNGNSFSASAMLTYRIQPWVLLSLNSRFDAIRLPEPHSSASFWLVTPKIDVTFSKSLFWSTLVQYSNQRNNMGINSRIQWRYAPLSDLYLVYNDNYFTGNFGPKFRSLNLKLSYWLNL